LAPDTQWPRYQVFVQEKAQRPFLDAGSVHAPDPELALLNARDVFVRRPQVTHLWVVPAESIFSRTAQELEASELQPVEKAGDLQEDYYAFCKLRQAGTQTLMGEVTAANPQAAMLRAIECFSPKAGGRNQPLAWWVFPKRAVVENQPQDAESLFSPAQDKPFRMSTDFHTHTMMRAILQEREEGAEQRVEGGQERAERGQSEDG
jgi:ring-1,2-phenylacetyl-CoA epoxidase subunit PaaB